VSRAKVGFGRFGFLSAYNATRRFGAHGRGLGLSGRKIRILRSLDLQDLRWDATLFRMEASESMGWSKALEFRSLSSGWKRTGLLESIWRSELSCVAAFLPATRPLREWQSTNDCPTDLLRLRCGLRRTDQQAPALT